jgi:hypothetical protein
MTDGSARCRSWLRRATSWRPPPFDHDEEGTMKYLCLVYDEEANLDAMSESELDGLVGECLAVDEELRKSGYVMASEALQPVQTATTVRVRNGRLSTTDGPFAETKEQLGGFFLIDARDLNDAIQVAAKIPSARLGSIEVRPVWEIRQQEPRARRC